MPAQPTWFARLPAILADLRALDFPYLDRQAFERLFRVRDRRARALMTRFQGIQLGNAWVVERIRLIGALEKIQQGEEFQWERHRRQRVAEVYEQAKREHPARQVAIPVARESRERALSSLPRDIQLAPGELRIQFTGFEDLLTKLFELGQAVENDFEAVRQFLEQPAKSGNFEEVRLSPADRGC